MKSLNECKEYYKDAYIDWLQDKENNTNLDRVMQLGYHLEFIYGEEFRKIEPTWRNEAIHEYYSAMNK